MSLTLPASLKSSDCHPLRASVYYRGVPILAAGQFDRPPRPNLTIVAPTLNSCTGPWSLDLDDLVARHVFSSVCARQKRLPAAPWPEGDEFTELVLNGLSHASVASTPAFNVDDHYQMTNAIMAAIRDVPEDAADTVEVGTFACHTAIMQAAVMRELGALQRAHLQHSMVHALDVYDAARRTCEGWNKVRGKGPPIHFHRGTALDVIRTTRLKPLRLFFEDSVHDYMWTKRAFTAFEPYLVEGGVVVMHDVGCCGNQYGGLMRFCARAHVQ